VWLDLWSMRSGESFHDAIDRAITDARTIVLLIDSRAGISQWQRFEWRKALECTWSDPDKQLLGLLIGTTDSPSFLAGWTVLRVEPEAQNWNRVVDQVVSALREGKANKGQRRAWRAVTPWRPEALQRWVNSLSPSPQLLREQKQRLESAIREAQSEDEMCDRLFELAAVQREMGEMREAGESLTRALAISSKLGKPEKTALLLVSLAAIDRKLGRSDEAIRRLQEALDLYSSLNRSSEVLSTLSLLASFSRESGQSEATKRYLEQAIQLSRALGDMAYPSTAVLEQQLNQHGRDEAAESK
jgi:tetratricopeptide (TPR) repeat protein